MNLTAPISTMTKTHTNTKTKEKLPGRMVSFIQAFLHCVAINPLH